MLFVCTANSARSQLAAGLWTATTGAPAVSAGTHPAERVHPGAVAAARRAGLDLGDATPTSLHELRRRPPLTITVCDRAHEELDPEPDWLHWSIPDPVAGRHGEGVRRDRRRAPPAHRHRRGCGMTELDDLPETGTGDIPVDLSRRLVAEALGTGLLIVAVIGSGIMASRLSPDDVGLQLLENAAATAGALIGLILMLRCRLRRPLQPGRHPRRPGLRHDHAAATPASTSSPRSSAAASARSSPT